MSAAKRAAYEQKLTRMVTELWNLDKQLAGKKVQGNEVEYKEFEDLKLRYESLCNEDPGVAEPLVKKVLSKLEEYSGSRSDKQPASEG